MMILERDFCLNKWLLLPFLVQILIFGHMQTVQTQVRRRRTRRLIRVCTVCLQAFLSKNSISKPHSYNGVIQMISTDEAIGLKGLIYILK